MRVFLFMSGLLQVLFANLLHVDIKEHSAAFRLYDIIKMYFIMEVAREGY